MKLGLKKDEVLLVPHTSEWDAEFIKIKQQIQKHTQIENNRIEHIGSTSIKGIMAKPIVDIVVGLDEINQIEKPVTDGFKKAGFLRLRIERLGEVVFAKFTDDTSEEKTHFIHLVEYEKELWKNLIFFRDYLNSHETIRKEYEQLKLDYVKKSDKGILAYTDHKEEFVKGIYAKRLNG
ncbi:GrpB family protein [Paenisporosarcina sp. NPDC076898]|uniref:GrpB family protein n=1 Tax=unclassified Paenisporosarcina TaxID=2642018 RepID=UPI003D001425